MALTLRQGCLGPAKSLQPGFFALQGDRAAAGWAFAAAVDGATTAAGTFKVHQSKPPVSEWQAHAQRLSFPRAYIPTCRMKHLRASATLHLHPFGLGGRR